MVIIFINDLQNRKLCKVIERYLAKIRFFTAKSQSVSGASHQPAYIVASGLFVKRVGPVHLVDGCLCVLCPLMIGLMVVLLTFLGVW